MIQNKINCNIAIAQLNPLSGNVEYNAKKIVEYIKKTESSSLDLIIFPELFLNGFPLEDTIVRHKAVVDNGYKSLEKIAKFTNETAVLVGFLEPIKNRNNYFNSFAFLQNGKIQKILRQKGLQLDSLFRDSKYIDIDSNINNCFQINGINYLMTIGNNILESDITTNNIDILINCTSLTNRRYQRKNHINNLSNLAKNNDIHIIYVNQIGAVDNNIFEGASVVLDNKGNITYRSKIFEEDFLIVNPYSNEGIIQKEIKGIDRKEFTLDYDKELEYTYKAAILGIKEYFAKTGFKRAVLGLSGGLDSTICSVLLADALGKENVLGISMPSKITTQESKSDAQILAQNLGINFVEKSIKEIVDTTNFIFNDLFSNVEKKWNCRYKQSFTQDNIQARSRAMYIWGVSNEFASCLPIATSDKSEIYMGYATINGDMSGGFAPIADIPKTKLFALAHWMNANRENKDVIPESIINKRPGAELAINPKTGKPLIAEDALMPYEFLDEIIWNVENKHAGYNDLVNNQFIYEVQNNISYEQKLEWINKFYKRMSTALYKWSILPPATIIEPYSINKHDYLQPITSTKINYEGIDAELN